jgi:hypothetical protein
VGSCDLNAGVKSRTALRITVSALRRAWSVVPTVSALIAKTPKTTSILWLQSERVRPGSKVVYAHGQIAKKTIVFATPPERSASLNAGAPIV